MKLTKKENESIDNGVFHVINLWGTSDIYPHLKDSIVNENHFLIVFLHYEIGKYNNWYKIILPAIYRLAKSLGIKRNEMGIEGISLEHYEYTKYTKYPKFSFNGKDFIMVDN